MSSATRCQWMLEELGQPFELRVVNTQNGENKRPEFLAINPNGKIPALVDGALRLNESMAINFYLAERYGQALLPSTVEGRALAMQWSFWAITNVQPSLLTVVLHKMILPAEKRSPELAEEAREKIAPLLQVLDEALTGRQYLVEDRFTVADVNTGSVLRLALITGLLAGRPAAEAWMQRLAERPAFKKVFAR
jgi:glutathione S-transferase